MRRIDYEGWAEYLLDIIDQYNLEVQNSLELAAGNCILSNYLSGSLGNLYSTDLSLFMLREDNQQMIPKVCCNMLAIPFKEKFDFIFCAFDSINYLMSVEELFAFFKEVELLLSDTGLLTFDASLRNNSIKNVKHLNRKGKVSGISYKQESYFDVKDNIHYNNFRIELPGGQIITEEHQQKIFPFTDYFEVIEDTNLYVSDCFDFFTFENATDKCERIQFIIRKQDSC